jgi:hypothetical protein
MMDANGLDILVTMLSLKFETVDFAPFEACFGRNY